MRISIRGKLLMGFGAVLLVTVLISIFTYVQVQNNIEITNRLNNLRQPTVLAGAILEDGIDQSLAGLRGYMILGGDPGKAKIFKAERLRGWDKIDTSVATLSDFSTNWTDSNNLKLLDKIKSNLLVFKAAQDEVEEISHTSENIPAINMLLTQAAPAASQVLEALNSLIEKEEKLPATIERKRLLKLLADSRGSFALCLANIRAYLLSGEKKFISLFDDHWKTNEARFQSLSDVSHLFLSTQGADWLDYRNTRQSFSGLPGKMFEMRSSEKWNNANFLLGSKAAPRGAVIKKLLAEMRQSQDRLMEIDQKKSRSTTELVNLSVLIGTLAALVIGVGIAFYVSQLISNPLANIVTRAKTIANKDLSSQPLDESGGDELATLSIAINQMSSTLRDVIRQVLDASKNVSETSKFSLDLNQKTSENLDDQQSQTEQIATAITEMNATVQEVSININGTAEAAHKADLETVNGKKIVNQTITGIHELHKQVEHAVKVIQELEQNSSGINSIMDVITGVAEQTNLLALNAAIEAARAGEQGRGFAVVADEVRTLAGKTQSSTEEINQMIEKLQSGTKRAVEVINRSREQAGLVSAQANEAGDSLSEIAQSVSLISDMSTQIAAAAEEQLAVTDEITRNVTAISDLSKETSSAAKESAQSSHDLHSSAVRLESLVTEFKI